MRFYASQYKLFTFGFLFTSLVLAGSQLPIIMLTSLALDHLPRAHALLFEIGRFWRGVKDTRGPTVRLVLGPACDAMLVCLIYGRYKELVLGDD